MESQKIKSRVITRDFLFFLIPWVAIVIYFNRIFRPPNRPPKDGWRPKDERLQVGDELGDDLGHDLGGQKKNYWIATLGCCAG